MIRNWIRAFRLRTLPLSFSLIIMGSAVAWQRGTFVADIFALALLTTLFLQILSNISNDYGDAVSGVDLVNRVGPERMVQSGAISKEQMRRAIVVFSILSLVAGIILLLRAWPRLQTEGVVIMFAIGLMAIAAAINYTVGKHPYGYLGFGDLVVFIFCGLVGVGGSVVRYEGQLWAPLVLPASSIGLLSIGVLNMNNMRDAQNDAETGKRTMVVRMGTAWAKRYHVALIGGAIILIGVYISLFGKAGQYLCMLALPIFVKNVVTVVRTEDTTRLDSQLRMVSVGTLVLTVLFAIGCAL